MGAGWTKETLAARLRELAEVDPGITAKRFQDAAPCTRIDWVDAFETSRWDEARIALLGVSNRKEKDTEPAFRSVCLWIQTKGRFPNSVDLGAIKRRDSKQSPPGPGASLPSTSVIFGGSNRWGGSWNGFKELVARYAEENSEFRNIVPVVRGATSLDSEDGATAQAESANEAVDGTSFSPPIVESLVRLATLESDDRKLDKEFERRVGYAFRILGLRVDHLGGGNEADGIVRPPVIAGDDSDWALIYDAKRWPDGYRFVKDEERKLTEYARVHGRALGAERIKNRYLVLVAGRFREKDVAKAQSLKREVGSEGVQEVCFVEADALVRLVERRLEEGIDVITNRSIGRLMRTGIVTIAHVDEL
ncbi:MAG: hypothetical protein IT381_25450 [Deltaproteobacteria bacterium]|nr:hypothetical protein [Deltaproteobacteria bacterium]